MHRFFLASFLCIATLALADGAPPITRRSVAVEGTNDEWTNSTLKLEKGDLAVVIAAGEVKVGDWIGKTNAAGRVPDSERGKAIREGTLVIKAGTGAARAVGERKWFLGATDFVGAVKLKVNDTKYTDNAGAYAVDVLTVPAASLPAPIDVTASDKVEVPAAAVIRVQATVEGTNDEWTSTGVKLEKGDLVLVEATGEVNGTTAVGALSSPSLSSAYCLTFKVGTGAAQYLGDVATLVAADAGLLKLRVNDKDFTDNKGKFTAVVTVLRSSALPAAEAVKAE